MILFEVYGKPNCVACEKAKKVLNSLGVRWEFKPILSADGTFDWRVVENLGDFHLHDGDIDHLPLVVLWSDKTPVKTWTGLDVAKEGESWTAKVKESMSVG